MWTRQLKKLDDHSDELYDRKKWIENKEQYYNNKARAHIINEMADDASMALIQSDMLADCGLQHDRYLQEIDILAQGVKELETKFNNNQNSDNMMKLDREIRQAYGFLEDLRIFNRDEKMIITKNLEEQSESMAVL